MNPTESMPDNFRKETGKRLQEMATQLAEAESGWQSENKQIKMRAEKTFVHWAGYLLTGNGRRLFEIAREIAENQPALREQLFRCFWRAIQTCLTDDTCPSIVQLENELENAGDFVKAQVMDGIVDPVKNPVVEEPAKAVGLAIQKAITTWMGWAFELYCDKCPNGRLLPINPDEYPPVLRDAVLFYCQNDAKMQKSWLPFLPIEIKVLIHLFGGHLLDQSALTWLVGCTVLDCFDSRKKWVSIAVDAKNPMALRRKADGIYIDSSNPKTERDEIAQLLWEAAIRGDAEAQCRQGEALLKDTSLLEPDDYRMELAELLWDTPKKWDVVPQCPPDATLLNDMLPQDLQQQACLWFQKAAKQGHARAMVQLGRLLSEASPEEAIVRFKEVEENQDVEEPLRASAEYEWGNLLLRRQEPVKALHHLRAAAQNENRAAMELLALDPSLGKMLSDEDIGECCHSLLEMTGGDSPTDMPLRRRVWTRLGQVAKSKSDRAVAFRKAAEAGDDRGAYEWARCLLFGDGCNRNLQEAYTWFLEAQKRYKGKDLATQALSWHKCLLSILSSHIIPGEYPSNRLVNPNYESTKIATGEK